MPLGHTSTSRSRSRSHSRSRSRSRSWLPFAGVEARDGDESGSRWHDAAAWRKNMCAQKRFVTELFGKRNGCNGREAGVAVANRVRKLFAAFGFGSVPAPAPRSGLASVSVAVWFPIPGSLCTN